MKSLERINVEEARAGSSEGEIAGEKEMVKSKKG